MEKKIEKPCKVNHKFNAAVTSGFNARRGTFEIVVHSDIKKGEQIFIEYGENKDNSELLLNYGFTLPSGQNDSDKINITKERNHSFGSTELLDEEELSNAVDSPLSPSFKRKEVWKNWDFKKNFNSSQKTGRKKK